ncbi:MAG: hypothetical protein JXL97_20290 [Bacteroidales bacterium]|nr:hypothetical protein [Bacteroidales bacterium]
MRKIKFFAFISFAMLLFACGGSSDSSNNEDETTDDKNVTTVDNESNDVTYQESCGFPIESVEDFLYYTVPDGMPSTFESNDGIYVFFREDGTMAGGGPTGEESMWEADWSFQPGNPTGVIVIDITMQATDRTYEMGGAYNVEFFPDDAALIFNCVDFIRQDY